MGPFVRDLAPVDSAHADGARYGFAMSDDFADQMARLGFQFDEKEAEDSLIPGQMLKGFLADLQVQNPGESPLLIARLNQTKMAAKTVAQLRRFLGDSDFPRAELSDTLREMAEMGTEIVANGEAMATAVARQIGPNHWEIVEFANISVDSAVLTSRFLEWEGDPRFETIRAIEAKLPELRAKGYINEDERINGVTRQKHFDRKELGAALKALRLMYGQVGDAANRQAIEREYEPMLLETLKVRLQ